MSMLLDDLATLAHCEYLSDLRRPGNRAAVERALLQLAAEDYPVEDWSETTLYLTGKDPDPLPAIQLRRLLLEVFSA